jgi:hypothetical protein
MTKNRKNLQLEKITIHFFWIKNYKLPIPGPPIKDVQAAEEAFSPQKRTSSTSKHEIFLIFLNFCGAFFPSWIRIRIPNPDSESGLRIRILIRIHCFD